MDDILRDHGAVFLGSRLKRLGERLQAGAAKVATSAGLTLQPAQIPLLAALGERAMTIGEVAQFVGISQPGATRGIGQLIELGLAQSQQGEDGRQRTVSLTEAGQAALACTRMQVMPQVGQAVLALLGGQADDFMRQLAQLEDALEATPLEVLAAQSTPKLLRIRAFSDDLAGHFHDINAEWINEMFSLEDTDREVLQHPRASIIEPGGEILFVEAEGLGIVGTCALQKTGAGGFELTKMGVRKSARGLKAGEFLLAAMIGRAMALGAEPLYLLSNAKCAAAVHLYEKAGFRHDAEIMARYGARYERCNVAMRYVAPAAGA
ncbi:bifunctional helix-turn-helix transcriptional regulator/GNAT family N-acetyltransferase [Massilia sp. YIM B02443]|uniref:bifunctional helix-turn-helix transcriptional regulator/GNAT family N-acetyltransferase n=1 Tax=Massilia sp. YIM B02443 TaxID=3050127 RepID=UPI0025B66DB0|nr:bifunctional helix-turn-helix transcriptional regulator/GNAT family N-acetyltransferase [Massilia sp. YIM B02443]MDN4037503.1 bifunctional helix-turn-helix transcriptional regulator/GNAT family N-acetyltransferase [Massilia sp. YIM B02443]